MKLVLFESKYRDALESMLIKFSKEVFDKGTCDVDYFIGSHFAIYIALDEDKVIGFSSYILNNYFGMSDITLGNSYVYIEPEYRNTKLMYLFSLQSGKICLENDFPLEHYYSSDGSFKLSRKLKGKKMYETYIYDLEEVGREFNRLKKIVKIKD